MAGCTVEAIKGIAFVGINIELFELCRAACICEEAVEGSTKAACRDPNTYSSNRHFDKNNLSHYDKQTASSVATASSILWFNTALKFRLVTGSAASSGV